MTSLQNQIKFQLSLPYKNGKISEDSVKGVKMSIIVRRIQEADAEAITRLLGGLGWFSHFTAEQEGENRTRVREHIGLCRESETHSLLVAESKQEGVLVGYAAVHWLPYLFLTAPEGYISELFVDEFWRGQGVGTDLINAIKAEGELKGYSRLMLTTNRTRESYQRAFYKKLGFTEREEMANMVYLFE